MKVERRITLFSREGCVPCRLVKPMFAQYMEDGAFGELGVKIALEIVEATADGDDDDDEAASDLLDPSITGYPTVALTDVSTDADDAVVRRRVSRGDSGQPLSALMGGAAIAKGLRSWLSATIGSFARPDFDAAMTTDF